MNPPEVDPRTIIDVLLGRVSALTAEAVSLQAQLLTVSAALPKGPCGCQEEGMDGTSSPGGVSQS